MPAVPTFLPASCAARVIAGLSEVAGGLGGVDGRVIGVRVEVEHELERHLAARLRRLVLLPAAGDEHGGADQGGHGDREQALHHSRSAPLFQGSATRSASVASTNSAT